jgi:hypothetical protein
VDNGDIEMGKRHTTQPHLSHDFLNSQTQFCGSHIRSAWFTGFDPEVIEAELERGILVGVGHALRLRFRHSTWMA